MPDRKPPRLEGDERATLIALLDYQRASFVRKLDGVGDEEASTPRVPSGTSLLWLVNHMADAETTWVLERFARQGSPSPGGPHAGSMVDGVARYERVSAAVDAVIAAADSLDLPCPPFDDQPIVNLRWIVAHLLEETARHAGHADIIRELIDGSTGR